MLVSMDAWIPVCMYVCMYGSTGSLETEVCREDLRLEELMREEKDPALSMASCDWLAGCRPSSLLRERLLIQ